MLLLWVHHSFPSLLSRGLKESAQESRQQQESRATFVEGREGDELETQGLKDKGYSLEQVFGRQQACERTD